MDQDRKYRSLVNRKNLLSFQVVVQESDIHVQAEKPLQTITKELILKYRGHIEAYIQRNPEFAISRRPLHEVNPAPLIIQDMIRAGKAAGVGPMASVAGAIAEYVGKELLAYSNEVVVENGGDIFMKLNTPVTIGIYAGKSPLSMKIGVRFNPKGNPFSVCTSSGTVGHSFSYGKSDAVCIVSRSSALADAAATAIGNHIQSESDIRKAVLKCKKINGISGAVLIKNNQLGLWGNIEVVPLNGVTAKGKKG
jgi:ApbE superfamily uncharacterized protein (UPF0280 family)